MIHLKEIAMSINIHSDRKWIVKLISLFVLAVNIWIIFNTNQSVFSCFVLLSIKKNDLIFGLNLRPEQKSSTGPYFTYSWCQFYQLSTSSFSADPKSTKKTVKLSVFLRFQDLRAQKLLVEHWWNWPLIYIKKWGVQLFSLLWQKDVFQSFQVIEDP